MIYWIILGILALITIAAVFVSTIAYKRQQTIYTTKSKIRQIKQKIDEYSDVLNTLLRTDPSYELIVVFQQQIASYHKKLVDLDSSNRDFLNNHQNEKNRLEAFKKQARPEETNPALDSDTEIETANIHINTLTKFINSAYKKGKISQTKYKDLIHHLQQLKLSIEVESHCLQAQKYKEANDRVLAQSHLKQAKEALRTTTLEFPEKNQKIRDISDQIKSVMQNVVVDEKAVEKEEPAETDETLKKKF